MQTKYSVTSRCVENHIYNNIYGLINETGLVFTKNLKLNLKLSFKTQSQSQSQTQTQSYISIYSK